MKTLVLGNGNFNIRVYWLIKTRSGNAGKYHCTLVARHERWLQELAERKPTTPARSTEHPCLGFGSSFRVSSSSLKRSLACLCVESLGGKGRITITRWIRNEAAETVRPNGVTWRAEAGRDESFFPSHRAPWIKGLKINLSLRFI